MIRALLLIVGLLLPPAASAAELLDEVEALEREIAALEVEVTILEEDLLYPASSRVAVYLAMDVGTLFQLDAVTVTLNGDDVAHHLYTDRQVAALQRGGVQKLYVGNARQGDNELVAVFVGRGPQGREFKRATSAEFEQSFEPRVVELTIVDAAEKHQPGFVAAVR